MLDPMLDSKPSQTAFSAGSGRATLAGRFATSVPGLILVLAALFWMFNVAWFWRYCGRNINADAISYIGIAHHISDGNFRASLHGYWSPLISWLIAATSFVSSDRTLAARVLMPPLLGASLILLYRLTQKLWSSKLLSAIAVLWFVTARGIAAFSLSFIGADLLLTATILAYFTQLLQCLEKPERPSRWVGLGVAHGVAFFAKAVAMPLLAFTTLVAVIWTLGKVPKKALASLLCAAIVPALFWAGWGLALRAKYGVFTTGYQLHWNLIEPNKKAAEARAHGKVVLHDARGNYDAYMVSDVMPPGSPFWQVKVSRASVLRQISQKERVNVPSACRELLVLLTPGGLLALLLCMVRLTRERRRLRVGFRFGWIVLFATAALVAAYCMLVFDGRYVIPVTPILIAVAVGFFLPTGLPQESPPNAVGTFVLSAWQKTVAALLLAGIIGVQIYRASPFRTMQQDFQQSVYSGAQDLRTKNVRTLVAIGQGPYPEHGVGWEAGMYAAYFAGSVMVGDLFDLPSASDDDSVVADIGKLRPDAVMVWGTTANSGFSPLINAIQKANPGSTASIIRDPKRGDVGSVLILGKDRE